MSSLPRVVAQLVLVERHAEAGARRGEKSPEIAFTFKLIREMYRKAGIAFGV